MSGQKGPRATPTRSAPAVSRYAMRSRVGEGPAARRVVGKEDGGLLLWLAVFIQLLRIAACLASRWRTPAALLCAKRGLVAGVARRAIEPAACVAAAPYASACASTAPASGAAASDCRHGRA